MLEETRRELAEARERSQLNPTHTFSPLPGFYDRPAELKAIERALEGEPTFTVLFGASSVGKVSKNLFDCLVFGTNTCPPDGFIEASSYSQQIPRPTLRPSYRGLCRLGKLVHESQVCLAHQ